MTNEESSQGKQQPWIRVTILVVSLCIAGFITYSFTGSVFPQNPKDALIFQNALLLVVLGSAILEYKFTKPADSVVNSLMGIVTLFTVYEIAPTAAWWSIFAYCLFVFVISTVCTAVSSGPTIKGWRKRISQITYHPSVFLGKARLLFSIVFLFGLLSFYNVQSIRTVIFVIFWGLFVVIWPLGLPELLGRLRRIKYEVAAIGHVICYFRDKNPQFGRNRIPQAIVRRRTVAFQGIVGKT